MNIEKANRVNKDLRLGKKNRSDPISCAVGPGRHQLRHTDYIVHKEHAQAWVHSAQNVCSSLCAAVAFCGLYSYMKTLDRFAF